MTYVPPALNVDDLMEAFNQFCNHPPKQLDPLLVASIASFGFVFFILSWMAMASFPFCSITPCTDRALGEGSCCQCRWPLNGFEMDYLAALNLLKPHAIFGRFGRR